MIINLESKWHFLMLCVMCVIECIRLHCNLYLNWIVRLDNALSCQYDNEGNEYKVGLLNSFKWYSLCSGGVCHMLYFLAVIKWYWYFNEGLYLNLYYNLLNKLIKNANWWFQWVYYKWSVLSYWRKSHWLCWVSHLLF